MGARGFHGKEKTLADSISLRDSLHFLRDWYRSLRDTLWACTNEFHFMVTKVKKLFQVC